MLRFMVQALKNSPLCSSTFFLCPLHPSLNAGKICGIVHVLGGFRYDILDHRWVPVQCIAFSWSKIPVSEHLKRVTGRIFKAENFFQIFFHKKTDENYENHQRSFKKYRFDFQDLPKNYSSRDTVPSRGKSPPSFLNHQAYRSGQLGY